MLWNITIVRTFYIYTKLLKVLKDFKGLVEISICLFLLRNKAHEQSINPINLSFPLYSLLSQTREHILKDDEYNY